MMADNKVDSQRIKVLETDGVLAFVAVLTGLLSGYTSLIWTGLFLLFIALFVHSAAFYVTNGWLRFSEITSRVSNAIILSALFYSVLTPIAFIYRIFHKDPLNLDLNKPGSFYSERNHKYEKGDLQKMW
jgi:hypothetical protein